MTFRILLHQFQDEVIGPYLQFYIVNQCYELLKWDPNARHTEAGRLKNKKQALMKARL